MHKIIDGKWVERFSQPIRIAHWTHAVSFIMLIITALPIYAPTFSFIFTIFGGSEVTRTLHKIFGFIFIAPTLFIMFLDRQGFKFWTQQILTWEDRDFKFFKYFPQEFLGIESNAPKQGFYNAGQKFNSLMTIFFSAMMVISGLIMIFKTYFPKGLLLWMYPLHSLCAAFLISLILGHAYLGLINPSSKASLSGMTRGYIDIGYAKKHHAAWYDEVSGNKSTDK